MLIHSKDDIQFVTEFPCFLGHPVVSDVPPGENDVKLCQIYTDIYAYTILYTNRNNDTALLLVGVLFILHCYWWEFC